MNAEGEGGAGVVKIFYQPYERLQYYLSAGAGQYTLRVPSGGTVRTLTGDRPGALYGAGFRGVLIPEVAVRLGRHHMELDPKAASAGGEPLTLMRPALTVDASGGWQRYHFNTLEPVSVAGEQNVDQRLDLWQLQLALEMSQTVELADLGFAVEPYGGVKWLRNRTDLKDLRSGEHRGGIKDTATPFVGLNLPVGKSEGFFAEASFINGIQYGAGLNIRFK